MLTECYYRHNEGVLLSPDVMEYPVYKLDFENNPKLSCTIRAVYDDGEIFYYLSDGRNFNFVDDQHLNPDECTQFSILDYASLADYYSDADYAADYGSKELPF